MLSKKDIVKLEEIIKFLCQCLEENKIDGLYFIKIKDCEKAPEPLQWFNAFELTREPQKNDDGLWLQEREDL